VCLVDVESRGKRTGEGKETREDRRGGEGNKRRGERTGEEGTDTRVRVRVSVPFPKVTSCVRLHHSFALSDTLKKVLRFVIIQDEEGDHKQMELKSPLNKMLQNSAKLLQF